MPKQNEFKHFCWRGGGGCMSIFSSEPKKKYYQINYFCKKQQQIVRFTNARSLDFLNFIWFHLFHRTLHLNTFVLQHIWWSDLLVFRSRNTFSGEYFVFRWNLAMRWWWSSWKMYSVSVGFTKWKENYRKLATHTHTHQRVHVAKCMQS